MSEKIYLGFAGKYNIRLGESLRIIKESFYVMKKQFKDVNLKELEKNISNIYIMYNIKNADILFKLISVSVNKLMIGDYKVNFDYRKNLIDSLNDEECIISFDTFNFLNEKVWPRIVTGFIDSIQKNNNGSFILRLKLPLEKIKKLYEKQEVNDKSLEFINETNKWLAYQGIGGVVMVTEEEGVLNIGINIEY